MVKGSIDQKSPFLSYDYTGKVFLIMEITPCSSYKLDEHKVEWNLSFCSHLGFIDRLHCHCTCCCCRTIFLLGMVLLSIYCCTSISQDTSWYNDSLMLTSVLGMIVDHEDSGPSKVRWLLAFYAVSIDTDWRCQ